MAEQTGDTDVKIDVQDTRRGSKYTQRHNPHTHICVHNIQLGSMCSQILQGIRAMSEGVAIGFWKCVQCKDGDKDTFTYLSDYEKGSKTLVGV